MNHIDMKDCTLFLLDKTGANFIALRIGEGNFAYTKARNIVTKKSRGYLDKIREGEDEPVAINFQVVWDAIESSGDEPPTLEEVLDGQGPGWVSAATDLAGPFSVNLQIIRNVHCKRPNNITFTDNETYNFPEFNYEELAHSLKDATIDCSGFSNRVKPTVSRTTT